MKTQVATRQLSALAHESRLDLFRRLVKAGPDGVTVGALAKAARLNVTTASAQLGVLTTAGLIHGRRDGRSIFYCADYGAIGRLIGFMMRDCCQGREEVVAPLLGRAR